LTEHYEEEEKKLLKCQACSKSAVYKCSVCGYLLCSEHAKLGTICPQCFKKTKVSSTIEKTSKREKASIREFVRKFWGEEEQLTFDKKFVVSELPGYVVKVEEKTVGFISFADTDDAIIIVALAVSPKYQGCGIGKNLIKKVQNDAMKIKKKELLVSTSNDDLPALGFYQSQGFQIYEVKPNVIAEKHGGLFEGIGKLPIRDELRMRKKL
jgi:ribosomal protein S18 acetylase RimI-like enzyme